MKNILSDKKNLAIAILALLFIIFASLYFLQKSEVLSPTVMVVGNKTITERDIINELKGNNGTATIVNMINAYIVSEYAESIGNGASDYEVNQLVVLNEHQADLMRTTIDQILEDNGMPRDYWIKTVRRQAVLLKLAYTHEEMLKAIADGLVDVTPYSMPEIEKVRAYRFADKNIAATSLAALKEGTESGLATVLSNVINAEESKNVLVFTPGEKGTEVLTAATKGLENGDISEVLEVKGAGFLIVKLIERKDQFLANDGNAQLMAAYALMEKDKKAYEEKISNVRSQAVAKINIDIFNPRYENIREIYKQQKLQNPDIPGFTK